MSSIDKLDQLLDRMWRDYIELSPMAQRIVQAFEELGENVVNDHIALRTFDHPRVNIDIMAKPFIASGYKEAGDYHFEEKKLYAKHFEHEDIDRPKIFISQLLTKSFSEDLQTRVDQIVSSLSDDMINSFNFTCSGVNWSISSDDYLSLKKESDYAAWIAAIGYRPNHFTVFVNKLKHLSTLESLNSFLKDRGFKLNDSGGEIKGSQAVWLEQSSTIADSISVKFSDKEMTIPSCYFEFAKRYHGDNGKLYQGFVAKSADKIFESTNKSQ